MSDADRLVELLVALRREGRQQSGLDARLVPPDDQAGYDVATRVAARLGRAVVGWKVAATNEPMQRALRTSSPIYGRVFAPQVKTSPWSVAHAGLLSPIPEVEYQVVLARDLPPRDAPWTAEEVADAVASMHPGIELAECRFVHDEQFPPLAAILADGSGSGTLIHGPAIDDWRERDIAHQPVTLTCNGQPRRSGTAHEAMGHPLVPLTWLANELSGKGIGLKAGEIVSTGTMTGMVRPRPGETWRADFGSLGEVVVTLE